MSSPNSTIRTKANPACFLCGSTGKIVYRNLTERYFGVPGTWQLKQCPQEPCGLIWLDPAPVPEDLHLAYHNYFTHSAQADGRSSVAKTFNDILYRCYQVAQFIPSVIFGLKRSREDMDSMFLNDVRPGRLLDVGCGAGILLNRMRQRGWKVDGIDLDKKALNYAKNRFDLDLHCGDLAAAKFPDNSFDAVTMHHVIEHVPNPVEFLKEARRILKPGGRLVMVTPNTKSNGLREFKEYWFGLDAPRHLNLYTPENLADCAGRAGLKAVCAFGTAAHADIFFGGSFSIREAAGQRTDGRPQFNPFRLFRILSRQYAENSQLSKNPDCGEEVVFIGTKQD